MLDQVAIYSDPALLQLCSGIPRFVKVNISITLLRLLDNKERQCKFWKTVTSILC